MKTNNKIATGIFLFLFIPVFIRSQSKENNYLGINGLKVKNNIAYFEFSTPISAAKTCLAKLKWTDTNYQEKRSRNYNELLHPVSRFDKNYFVWEYDFRPYAHSYEFGSKLNCETPGHASQMRLSYRNNSPVSVGQYMLGREGLRSLNIECNGDLIYSTPNVLTLRFTKVNLELVSVKRGMEDIAEGTLMEWVTVLENLSPAELNQQQLYVWLQKLSDAVFYSFETIKTMHINAVNLDGL